MTPPRRLDKRMFALLVLAVPASVLAYGYWFAETHGSLYVSVSDVGEGGRSKPVDGVELRFRDAGGELLAEARSSPPYGTVYLTSPSEYACHEVEVRAPFSVTARGDWDRCFEGQSRWISTWIGRARSVDLRSGPCQIDRMPITVSKHGGEWWIWWIPLPHAGGKPYTLFSVSVRFDPVRCQPGR